MDNTHMHGRKGQAVCNPILQVGIGGARWLIRVGNKEYCFPHLVSSMLSGSSNIANTINLIILMKSHCNIIVRIWIS